MDRGDMAGANTISRGGWNLSWRRQSAFFLWHRTYSAITMAGYDRTPTLRVRDHTRARGHHPSSQAAESNPGGESVFPGPAAAPPPGPARAAGEEPAPSRAPDHARRHRAPPPFNPRQPCGVGPPIRPCPELRLLSLELLD